MYLLLTVLAACISIIHGTWKESVKLDMIDISGYKCNGPNHI